MMNLNGASPSESASSPAKRRTRAAVVWLLLYIVWMLILVGGLIWGRHVALTAYGDAAAKAEWSEFRAEMSRLAQEGPVARRPPQSAEPPALVLMRDYFGVCLAATVIFGSLLFAMIAGAVQGAFSRDFQPRDEGAN